MFIESKASQKTLQPVKKISMSGFHGTTSINAKKILAEGFTISRGDEHWLGDGTYFFIEGLSRTPDQQAEKWAKAEITANRLRDPENRFSVIRATISAQEENFLDLTTANGVEILDRVLETFLKRFHRCSKSKLKSKFHDGMLLNFVRAENILPLEIAKGNFYIKFQKEREIHINLRTSNCTICAVFDPARHVKDLTVHIEGDAT